MSKSKASKIQNRSTKDDEVIADIPAACADEKAAVEFMEKQRWGDHPACPRCGDLSVYQMKDAKTGERQANFRWRCHGCKEQFIEPLKGDVEVDEVFIGGKPRHPHRSRKTVKARKVPVVGMLERGGRVRPRIIADVTGDSLKNAIRENVDKSSRILTDEWSGYRGIGKEYAGGHETVRHTSYEYVRGDVHTNSIEGFFGMMRRGLNGIYHSVSKKHLHRYLSEFEFRHNNRELTDGQSTKQSIRSANHKRLLYKQLTATVE